MSKSQRDKGARGEREWAAFLTDLGFEASRGRQYKGGPGSPDICGGIPGTHAEVKRVETLRIHEALAQATRDSGMGEVPYVASRRNGDEWLVTIRARDLLRLAELIGEGK